MPAVIGISLFFILFTVITLLTMNFFVQKEVNKSQVTLDQVVQLRVAMQEAAQGPQATSSIGQLQQSVDWAESQSVEMVPLLEHFVGLLPTSGYFENFLYTLNGSINLTAEFDRANDVAYYLHHLNSSPYVKEVSLSSISNSDDKAIGQFSIILDTSYVHSQQVRGDR